MPYCILLFLACILSGFALLQITLTGALAGLTPILHIIATLVILVFALVIIYKGFVALIKKKC
ncbi:hypothetical protein [Litchfieldia salsa]|uniref:Uncharacterized protein n=1 Tax=Litchfieldia salsa TaxID=930152 RepID=A0A1H0RX56_9BACI|nr:hypothetical protein [Litchfieldia salsa]SDP33929.1 hypothetical protein SAMN05216565_102421 [Litchfieldia salsa]